MKEHSQTCERVEQLMSVLYGEATEREAAEFQRHIQVCKTCEADMLSFTQLRGSVAEYKSEALAGFMAPRVAIAFQETKSAFVALREFFNLSPLWLKGALALACLLFVVFGVMAFAKFNRAPTVITASDRGAKYTEAEKNQLLQEALQKQKAELL